MVGERAGIRRVAVLCSLGALGVACNLVTGADGIEFVSGVGGSSTSSGKTSSAANGPGATGPGANGSASSAEATSQTVASSAGSGDMVASSSSGNACTYPAGPFGTSQGKVLKSTLSWQGYPAGGMQAGPLTIQDLFDCDGSKGINAIMFDTAQWG